MLTINGYTPINISFLISVLQVYHKTY